MNYMDSDKDIKGNLEICTKDGVVTVSVNPKIYPLDVIYSAAYVFLDRAYIIIDGDPDEEIVIEFRPKDKGSDLESLGNEFNNELLSYSVYKTQSEKNSAIRQLVLQRALFTNDPELEDIFSTSSGTESYEDDPEGIAVPWEDKFGDKSEKKKD